MNERGALPPLVGFSQSHRDAIDQVLRCIAEGTYCALIGPRFSGKSELLRAVMQTLRQDPTRICLHLDLQDVESSTQSGFFASLFDISARRLLEIAGCKLPASYTQPSGSVAFRAFLRECVGRLQRDMVLVIDSLEAIPNDLVQALLTSLRAAYMDQQDSEHRLVVVLSGALSLAKRAVGESSPLRGIAERVLVRELSETESAGLVAQQIAEGRVAVSPAARALLRLAAQGDPTLINWVCQRCVQIVRETPLKKLTASTVKRVMREFARDEAPNYSPLQEATRLIEDDPDLVRCILQLLERHTVPLRELPLPLSPDLDPLYLTGMVRKVQGDHYQLRNDLYRRHLSQHFDPGRVGHLLTMTGRWDAAIDYLQASIEAGDRQYRPDLLAASINSMYAAEDVQHAVHYLTRGLSGAFGVNNALVWHAEPDQNSLRLVGIAGWADDDTIRDTQEVAVTADRLEARAYREVDSLRGQELGGCVERAVPLVIPGAEPIGVVTIVDCRRDTDPALQRELDLELVGYLNQAARAIHEVHTRENQLLRIAKLEQERTAQELRMAREIQVSFLPAECPTLPGWEVAADWRAAREVGGDFYDFVPVDSDHLGLVIADVSDKGVPAALFMSLSWTLMRVTASEALSPAMTLQRVNDLLMSESRSGMFLTLFYGILNWRTGILTYARAGHNPPILWRAKAPGPSAEADVVSLRAQGAALGVQRNLTWEEDHVQVHPGDILVLYTDGVTEPINERETEFGVKRLIEAVRTNSDSPCGEIISQIGVAVADFVGDQPQFDDYTLLGFKRLPLPGA